MKRLILSALLLLPAFGQAGTPSCPQNGWAGTVWQTIDGDAFTLSGAMGWYTAGTNNFRTSSGGNTNDNGSVPSCATAGCADYSFTVGAADVGYYKIQAFIRAEDGGSDSFFAGLVGVNDACAGGASGSSSGNPAIRRWDVDLDNNYQWRYITDWNNNNDFASARVWYLTAGTYTIRFIGREQDTRINQVRLLRQLTAPTPTPTPVVTVPALGSGLTGNYYDGVSFNTSLGSRTDAQVNFNYATGGPAGYAGAGTDTFSVQWCGEIEFPAVGNYVLYTNTDDGVRLYLDCALLIDQWADQSATEHATAPIVVTATGKQRITLQYYENGGDARAELRWASGSIAKQLVPQNRLYPGACCPSGGGPLPSATPTSGATPTPAPTVWAGLPAAERLNGLEYIPFPTGRQGSVTIHPLSVTFSSAAANNIGRNTARWRIVLQDPGSIGSVLQVETRLGAAGEDCSTGYFEPAAYASATTLTLPDRPQNLSTTYAWVDAKVPVTERFDAMGDPRYVPYADVIGAAANANDIKGGYNWYFKDLRDTAFNDYQAEYTGFLPHAVTTRYNGQPNFDVPKLFAIWREAIVASKSIYTSMTGYSSYYIGVGGEIGGDSANKLSSGGVPAYSGPWGAGGSGGKEEIIGSAVLVRNATWRSRPELGELWPDSAYLSDWSSNGPMATWGNLRNSQQGGSAYRQAKQSAGTAAYEYPQVRHRTESRGSASFMNGHGGSAQFNHFTNQFNASLLYDGTRMAQDYNFSMPAVFNVDRSWGLIQGGNQPEEWNEWPYKDRRLALEIYSATDSQPANTWGFYRRDGGNDATQRAAAAVRGIESSGAVAGQPSAGWFVINGLKPSTDSGINFVARFAILSCLRTFHDAGVPTTNGNMRNRLGANTYRIQTVPLVQITHPKVGQDLAGDAVVTVDWKQRAARWDKARYTENYPCLDAAQPPCAAADPNKAENPALEWHDDAVLVFNIKYSLDGGSTWASALTDAAARPGVYMDGADSIAQSPSHLYSYSWDVSGLSTGQKLLRVEAYRRDLGLHYAYHEMSLKTAP